MEGNDRSILQKVKNSLGRCFTRRCRRVRRALGQNVNNNSNNERNTVPNVSTRRRRRASMTPEEIEAEDKLMRNRVAQQEAEAKRLRNQTFFAEMRRGWEGQNMFAPVPDPVDVYRKQQEEERLQAERLERERQAERQRGIREEAYRADGLQRQREEVERMRRQREEADRLRREREEVERMRREREEADRLRREREEVERMRRQREEADRLRREREEVERMRREREAAEEAEQTRFEEQQAERERQLAAANSARCQLVLFNIGLMIRGGDNSPQAVRQRFRRWILINHPDKGGNKEVFQEVSNCMDVLYRIAGGKHKSKSRRSKSKSKSKSKGKGKRKSTK